MSFESDPVIPVADSPIDPEMYMCASKRYPDRPVRARQVAIMLTGQAAAAQEHVEGVQNA